MLVRVKEVDLDACGTRARIAAHTFGQLEAFAAARISGGLDEAEAKAANEAIRRFVCEALNNADPNAAWTPDRIAAEMDPRTFQALFQAALEFDGLTPAAGSAESPGETQAA